MPFCSIIIPVFNRANLTRQCLEALLATRTECPFEVIVVDNASRDGTARMLAGFGERIRVITHETNRFFAGACNRGAEEARGSHLVFLNNDTIPLEGWLDALVRYAASHPEVGLVGSKLLYPNGTVQHAGMTICQDGLPRTLYVGFPGTHPAVNHARRLQMVTGACILLSREVFAQAGGFDPVYVNGHEDVDLCYRIDELGLEVHYCPQSTLFHLESVSEGRFLAEDKNWAIFSQRWRERLRPDDLLLYLEDGLIRLQYYANRLELIVAPELGVVGAPDRGSVETLLTLRADQVYALIRENSALRADHPNPPPPLRAA